MQLDRKSLNRLLLLSDRQLQTVIERISRDYGLDLSRFQVKAGDMESLRQAIRSASDAELLEFAAQLKRGGR